MSKVLSRYNINFILHQMVAFTFLCIMAYIDYYIGRDYLLLRVTILSFTIALIGIYEIFIFIIYRKAKRNIETEAPKKSTNNEKYLWFVVLLLLDIILIVQIIEKNFEDISLVVLLLVGFVIFNIISTIVKPFFGIKHKK